MSKINILPANVYNRIAAGEVVDRPYSVVKELVENAIDAGATEIEIYIERGGKQLVEVIDNGCGIEREDLQSAFLPHATSKIAKADDLDNILTLGFRGEAVASIASVSKMTITSKTKDGKCYSLTSDGGKMGEITEAAGNDGTDVKVEMLFFNTPVRLKFLKTDKGEEADVTNFVSRFILCRPDIAFTYYVNGKKILQSFGGGDEEAIVSVYGASILSNCYKLDADKHGIKIRGYIGNQNFSKPNKTYQSVFLNGRYVVNNTISTAISTAYAGYLMKRQYPFYVLHIDVPTEIVDVNVHPSKADVRFADNSIVFGCIRNVISAVLDGNSKALDYVAETPTAQIPAAQSVQSTKTAKTESEQFSIPAPRSEYKTEPAAAELPVLSSEWRKPVDLPTPSAVTDLPFKEVPPAPKREEPFTIPNFSYQDAKREIEKSAPAFTADKKSDKLGKPQRAVGFIPIEEIPDYDTKHTQGEESGAPASKKSLEESFPNLNFNKVKIQVGNAVQEDVFAENKRYLEQLEEKMFQSRIEPATCVFVGKLFNTYLIYEGNEEIYIIDQHAAHERLIYDRLRERLRRPSNAQQPLITPFEIRLNAFESAFIRERMEDIRGMGFSIQEEEEGRFAVTAIPYELRKMKLNVFFNEILGNVNNYRAIKLPELLKDKLAMAACKAAVKGGMDLTQSEIDELFKQINGNMGLKCPHGRPVVVKMTRTELEKLFKRIV